MIDGVQVEVDPVKRRWVSRFSWAEVDPFVLRALLSALPSERDGRRLVRGSSPERLAQLSAASFGSPPRADLIRELTPVLLEAWLPRAPKESVERFTTLVQAGLGSAGRVDLTTKQDMVVFLRKRNLTKGFLHNLRAEFIHAHRHSSLEMVIPTVREEARGPIILRGLDVSDAHAAYPHQLTARQQLDVLQTGTGPRAGLIVLPTGAGKTETAVEWLLARLEEDPDCRVLWLAHQQELLEQAMKCFQNRAEIRPTTFTRRARLISGDGCSFSTLAEKSLDVAVITIQTASARWDERKRKGLMTFTARPTYVVVDEAHHAGSPGYERVLDVVGPRAQILIGLTATPWPSGAAAGRLRRRFPVRIVDIGEEELIAQGILARPVLHSIETGQMVLLNDGELKQAITSDLPPSVLKHLQNETRDRLIVSSWVQHRHMWGKTLVFATRIEHADELGGMFEKENVPVRVIHSRTKLAASEILDWFRAADGEAVLVSVGMLTEGVDLPHAETAFLARPTTSRILLRQMIGRVLRGPRANGALEAHIVDFRDRWENFADVLEPDEVIELDEVDGTDPKLERRLPKLRADDGQTCIPDDVAAQIRRSARAAKLLAGAGPRFIDPLLVTSSLAGWYDLADRRVPVFEHQEMSYKALLDGAIDSDLRGIPFLSYFEDDHPPYPSQRALRDLVDHVREFEETPPFVAIEATIGPQLTAAKVLDAGPLDDWARAHLIKEQWEATLVRVAYPSLEAFEVAVERELRQHRLRQAGEPRGLDPERPIPQQQRSRHKALPRSDRSLEPAKSLAVDRICLLLPSDVRQRLDAPRVDWTDRVVATTFGHWSMRLSGRGRGAQTIRINRLLRCESSVITDEMLGYLVYHELLHHLLPGLGHDSEFRDYESRWPDALSLDAAFDTLHEAWDVRPERYLDDQAA